MKPNELIAYARSLSNEFPELTFFAGVAAVILFFLFMKIFAFIISAIFSMFRPKDEPVYVGYGSKQTLLTKLEADAFTRLLRGFDGLAHVCPKVRIADILEVRKTGHQKIDNPMFYRIAQKHVDFVLIDFDGCILFAVEVDDYSHQKREVKERDRLVNSAFKDAGIPLVRVLPYRLRESEELIAQLNRLKEKKRNDLNQTAVLEGAS